MILSFVYRAACDVFQLLALRLCSSERKELEIFVLRHELAIARRQLGTPRPSATDRALLAALSKALPRSAWSAFAVSPKTLLGWHRRLVRRHWTYDRRGPGRAPLDGELQSLIVRLGAREPALGLPAHRRRASQARAAGFGDVGACGAEAPQDPAGAAPVWPFVQGAKRQRSCRALRAHAARGVPRLAACPRPASP